MVLSCEPWTEDTFAWMARHPDLPGCMSHGETPEEALANLADARALYIETRIERGLPVPGPESSPVTQASMRALAAAE